MVVVELQPALPNTGSFLICPTYGVIVLATKLRNLGYSASIMVEGTARFSVGDLEKFDYVCFSIKSASANKTYQMADRLRKRGKTIIFGGTHATYFPQDCLAHCDYVVRGEGDDVLPDLLRCLRNNQDPRSIKSLSYISNGRVEHTEDATSPADLTTPSDYSLIMNISSWGPVACLFRGRRIMLPVQSSRGCLQNCSFCVVNRMFGSSYRKRPIKVVISEIKSAIKYTSHIQFVDNDFIGSSSSDIEHTVALLNAIIDRNLDIRASVFVTIDIAKRHELLRLMRRAGICILMIGFESISQEALAGYRKSQNLSGMERDIRVIKEYGFSILGSFMAGSDAEDGQTIIQTSDLAARWGIDQLYYFTLFSYPDMAEIIPPHRVFLNNWDFATGHHVTFFPKDISPSELQKIFLKSTADFYSLKRTMQFLWRRQFKAAKELFLRRVLFKKVERAIRRKYISFLKKIEKGLYPDGKLDEQLLKKQQLKKLKYWDDPGKERLSG